MKRYTERPMDINTCLYRNLSIQESTAQFLSCKYETVSHRPPRTGRQYVRVPTTCNEALVAAQLLRKS